MAPTPGLILRTRYLTLLVEEVTPAAVVLAYLDDAALPQPWPAVGIHLADWPVLEAEAAIVAMLDA